MENTTAPAITLDDVRALADPVLAACATDAELAEAARWSVGLLMSEQTEVLSTIKAEQRARARQTH